MITVFNDNNNDNNNNKVIYTMQIRQGHI